METIIPIITAIAIAIAIAIVITIIMTIKTNKTNKPFSFYKEGFISLSALLYSNKLLWSISQTSLVLGGGVQKTPSGIEGVCILVLM